MLLVQLGQSFSSLKHRNFKRFILGQSISLIGTWVQNIAKPWLVLELTGSPLLLGITVAAQTFPQMIFTIFAGSLIDHLPKKKILLATQSVFMFLALLLSLLVFTGWVEFWHVLVIALVFGTNSAIDMPARQAYMIELVGRKDLMNAIGINSTIFNLARVVGPSIGGLLIASLGIAACFLINGLTYIAVIYGLILIDAPFKIQVVERINLRLLIHDMVEGIRYVLNKKNMRYIFSLFFFIGIFALNFNVLNPVLAKSDFQMGAAGLSILMACMGAGALTGALMIIFLKTKKAVLNRIFAIAAALSISQIFMGLSPYFWIACIFMASTGLFMVLLSTQVNSTIQLESDDQFRGRVVSFYVFVFVGVAPLGSIYSGSFSSWLGAQATYILSGSIALTATFLVWLKLQGKEGLVHIIQNFSRIGSRLIISENSWSRINGNRWSSKENQSFSAPS